jgi:hypothetical protein
VGEISKLGWLVGSFPLPYCTHGGEENTCRILLGNSKGNRPIGIPRSRLEDNIKLDLRKIGLGVEWIHPAQDEDQLRSFVNTIMNLRVL